MSAAADREIHYAVPSGQEAVLGRMLNPAGLAEHGWAFARLAVRGATIDAFYRAAAAAARITLAHPSAAPGTWPRTERFAVGVRVEPAGAPAAPLLRAIVAAVRGAEGEFAWREVSPGRERPLTPDGNGEAAAQRARAAEAEVDLHLEHTPFIDLRLDFDHAGALAEALALRDRFVAYQSDPTYGVRGWRGLALQALDGDATRAATTEADEAICADQSRYRLTDVAARCPITLAFLQRILDFERCRTVAFLLLEPGARIAVHVDGTGPLVMRSVNVALNMPAGCTLTIDCNPDGSDHAYTRRAPFRDGTVLLMNVAKYHSVVNDSPEPRVHVISRGSLRMAAPDILSLAEAQNGLHGPEAIRAALAEKRRTLGAAGSGNAVRG